LLRQALIVEVDQLGCTLERDLRCEAQEVPELAQMFGVILRLIERGHPGPDFLL
jgi:hypothetical protein